MERLPQEQCLPTQASPLPPVGFVEPPPQHPGALLGQLLTVSLEQASVSPPAQWL